MNIPPGLEDQIREEYKTTGTVSDHALHQMADIVRANHPHLRGAAAVPDWVWPLVRQIITIILGLIPAAKPMQPE